jgi:hypothetical protein
MKILWILFVQFLLCLSPVFSQNPKADEAQIADIVAELSAMWAAPDGSAIADKVTARNGLFVGPQGTMSRPEYLKMLSFLFQNGGIQNVAHQIVSIRIQDNLAYEKGVLSIQQKDGKEQRLIVLNLFVKEDGVWKYCGNLSADLVKALAP